MSLTASRAETATGGTASAGAREAATPVPARPVPATLARVRDLVDAPMRLCVGTLAPSVGQVVAYHLGWVDADGTPREANGGKAVRPALAILAAEAAGAPAEVGIPGALAVEFVHNFSLLHDDVMDRDEERRHRPTAWTVFGSSAAILAGDALLALSFEALQPVAPAQAIAAQATLATATQRLIVGQIDDLDFERRMDVDLDECVRMAAGKTAALMACAASIGAHLAAAPEHVVGALETFGYELGLAFQLVDDVLGIWGTPDVTGKPVGADLRARKKSLPVVAAMTSRTDAGAELRSLYESGELHASATDDVVARAAALVEDAGGRVWASDEATRRLVAGCDALGLAAEIDPAASEALLEIARYVTARDH